MDDGKILAEGEVTAVSRGRMINVRLDNGHTAVHALREDAVAQNQDNPA